jgi:pyruvate, orthophosphate dikinase
MTTARSVPIARLRDIAVPVPTYVRLDIGSSDDQLREQVTPVLSSLYEQAGESSDDSSLSVAISAGMAGAPVMYLGAAPESLNWLSALHNGAPVEIIRQHYNQQSAHEPIESIIRFMRSRGLPTVMLLPMLLGHYTDGDGSGIACSRDPETGRIRTNGLFLGADRRAKDGADAELRSLGDCGDEPWWSNLSDALEKIETHCGDAIELEFIILRGDFRVLGARSAVRTGAAACKIAAALVAEGRLDPAEALRRVTPAQFAAAIRPFSADMQRLPVLGRGLGVSPGTATGTATFDPVRAVERGQKGEAVVLIRSESRPEDLTGLLAAVAVVTIRGGRTSHAAVIARAVGRPCVVGLTDAAIDKVRGMLNIGASMIAEGDIITVDGTRGTVTIGRHSDIASANPSEPGLGAASQQLLTFADSNRRMEVWANVDTAEDAAAARELGATGVGLCRTEHMFLGERRHLLENILLNTYDRTAQESLYELHQLQRKEFDGILAAMDGLPVTVRLLDPPRHEFMPDISELAAKAAVARALNDLDVVTNRRLTAVERKRELNPMLGVRGVRLGVLLPWLYEMQIVALLEAAAHRFQAGGSPRPMLLVPMVAAASELRPILTFTRFALDDLRPLVDGSLSLPVGVMIETPRAALTAAELAEQVSFFSFGTNDLTQLTWGLSRDDVDTPLLRPYQDLQILDSSPFDQIDKTGVGQLMAIAIESGRRTRAGMRMGVCGEHASDPDSIAAFHEWGLDYISCSRHDLTLARYAAGYAAR